jgi:2-succinyl-6-hydroxy-2,4-cyclohexadiene-1-carboxylate synthase
MISLSLRRRGAAGTKLFIHGFLGSGEDWAETINQIESDCSCVTLDLPSHGKAPELASSITSFEDVIQAIGESLKESLSQPVHGIGYSLGGRILLGLTLRYPDLFNRLTFISTFPGFQEQSARNTRWESDLRWSSLLRSLDNETFLTQWYAQETFQSAMWSDATRAKFLGARSALALPTVARLFEATSAAKMPSHWLFLQSLLVQTTFIAGERDVKYVEIGKELVTRNPRIHLEIVPQCGHAIPLEDPTALAKAL